MKVFITGGSGFTGRAIARELDRGGHETISLCRTEESARSVFQGSRVLIGNPTIPGEWAKTLASCDGCVNLAGEPLNEKWTREKKRLLRESRIDATRNVVAAVPEGKDFVLFSASAVGAYGDGGENLLTENSPYGDNFLAKLTREWEESALEAEKKGARVIIGRFGLVLGKEGGALPPLVTEAKKARKIPEGSGKQWMSWIHVEDLARAVRSLIENPEARGIFNLVSPHPARQKEITSAIEEILGPPARLRPPSFAARLVVGEMADLVLLSHKASAEKLEAAGFSFDHTGLRETLVKILA